MIKKTSSPLNLISGMKKRLKLSDIPVLPDYLECNFAFNGFHLVKIKHLYAGLIMAVSDKYLKYVPVEETPHYIFARHILKGDSLRCSNGYTDYRHYIAMNPRPLAEETFIRIIHDIKTNGYDWEKGPIFVFRHWSRPLPFGRWDVGDGLHRLSILAALGENQIRVATLCAKHNIFTRLFHRIKKERYAR